MKILKEINIRNAVVNIVDIFKNPTDEKLIAIAPEPAMVPKLVLVPDLTIVPEPAMASKPPAVAPKLTIVPERAMDAALRLSREMVARINKKRTDPYYSAEYKNFRRD